MNTTNRPKVALQHDDDGPLNDAKSAYREMPRRSPGNIGALTRLSFLSRREGQLDVALDFETQAVAAQPESACAIFHLGECYRALARVEDAISSYRRALERDDSVPQIYFGLGHAYAMIGRDVDAAAAWREAMKRDPAAVATYEHLSACLARCGLVDEAEAVCRSGISIAPDRASFHARLATLLSMSRRRDEALRHYLQTAALQPAASAAHCSVAVAMNELLRPREAHAAASKAIDLDSNNAVAHLQRGIAARRLGNMDRAVIDVETAMRLAPRNAQAYVILANMEMERLSHSKARDLYTHAVDIAGGALAVRSHAIFASNAWPDVTDSWVFEQHREWGNTLIAATPLEPPPVCMNPDVDRPLRVGYVSPDLREHPVAHFLMPILSNHRLSQVEAVLFSDVPRPDDTTRRLKTLATGWIDTWRLSDLELARLVRQERIDILVDLVGHCGSNRLAVFARRPAPVQVTYLGYPNTTGLPRDIMGYRLTDSLCDPPGGSDEIHTELLVRLPNTFICYAPPIGAADIVPAPCTTARFITFGSFNTMMKITREMVKLWARIILRVPRSRLLLKNRSMNDPAVRRMVEHVFRENGVDPSRLSLCEYEQDTVRHFQCYGTVDIALDTFPYNGTTTTCETLWMGVPVVSLAGTAHRSRVGLSLLTAIGAADCIAQTPDEYVELAVRLGMDFTLLATARADLRRRMARSPLMNAPQFVNALERAYRQMWARAINEPN